jgi:hypothetical protein
MPDGEDICTCIEDLHVGIATSSSMEDGLNPESAHRAEG